MSSIKQNGSNTRIHAKDEFDHRSMENEKAWPNMKSALLDAPNEETASLTVELIPASDRNWIAPLWIALEEKCQPVRLSARWTWVSTWLDVFGDTVPHWFAVAHCNGIPVGTCLVTCTGPWLLRQRGTGVIKIGTTGEPLGHSIATEYNDILVDDHYRLDFAKELLHAIRRELRPFAISLPAFSRQAIDPFIRADESFTQVDERCPVFELELARNRGAEPISLLRSSVRARLRRSLRELQPYQTEWASTVEQADDILDELIDLHQRRWMKAGRIGAFSSDRFQAFHRALVPKLLAEERVVLFRLRQGSSTVGTLYSFIDNGDILFYQSGFAQFEDNKIRPGLTTHLLCIDECLARGYTTYNFLSGEQRYKDELSTTSEMLINAQAPGYRALAPLVHYAYRPDVRERMRTIKHFGERVMLMSAREHRRDPV